MSRFAVAPEMPQAIRVGTGGTLSYLASDGLSSLSEALDSSGNVTAQRLYAPYGGSRYSNGTMPTSKGFTGQRADSGSSGLDCYGARYYDPLLGQFASADTARDGLNRYGYVHGNQTTMNDPSGHYVCGDLGECLGGGDVNDPSAPTPTPTSTTTTTTTGKDTYGCSSGDSACLECECDRACATRQIADDDLFIWAGVAALFAAITATVAMIPLLAWMMPAIIMADFVLAGVIAAFAREAAHELDFFKKRANLEVLSRQIGLAMAGLVALTPLIGGLMMVLPGLGTAVGGGIKLIGLITGVGLGALAVWMLNQQEAELADPSALVQLNVHGAN